MLISTGREGNEKMRKEMTEDTREAIEIILPLAEKLGISVRANKTTLKMDNQAIGIGCNSTWATLMEMIGWIFYRKYCKEFRPVDIDYQEVKDTIMRYWVNDDLLKKLGEEIEGEEA